MSTCQDDSDADGGVHLSAEVPSTGCHWKGSLGREKERRLAIEPSTQTGAHMAQVGRQSSMMLYRLLLIMVAD